MKVHLMWLLLKCRIIEKYSLIVGRSVFEMILYSES